MEWSDEGVVLAVHARQRLDGPVAADSGSGRYSGLVLAAQPGTHGMLQRVTGSSPLAGARITSV